MKMAVRGGLWMTRRTVRRAFRAAMPRWLRLAVWLPGPSPY